MGTYAVDRCDLTRVEGRGNRVDPLRRLAEPRGVGWAVRFLASEEAGYITGQTLVIDGGQVLPEGSA